MPFLPGFEERWRDAPDFLSGIDREVWEGRRLDRLARYYAEDAVVRRPEGLLQGRDAILAEAHARLAAFPNLKQPAEDVIWGQAGYKSFSAARRFMLMGTHDGDGSWGAPTGRDVAARALVDCWCRNNEIADEWRITDRAAIAAALGLDLVDWTRRSIQAEGGPEHCLRPLSAEDTPPPAKLDSKGNGNTWADTLADSLGRIMNGDFSVIGKAWDSAAELAYPGGQRDSGHQAAQQFWSGLRAALPSARFEVVHALGMENKPESPRVALRWELSGTHDGFGMFGAPSGAALYVMGMTHAEFGPRGLRREWSLIDTGAIWRQILLATGVV